MKIGFAGAGAIGCHYGSKLQQAGCDVLLLARGQHLKVLQQHGLRHQSEGKEHTIAVAASDDFGQLYHCQIVIISCKMTGLPDIISALQSNIHPDALLVTLQNGVEAPDQVAKHFSHHAIAAGTAFIGARLEQPGHVIHSAAGGIRIGLWRDGGRGDEGQGAGAHYLPTLLEALQSAAVPARVDIDPTAMLWRKLLWNCGFNAITAITRRYASDMAAHADTLHIVRQAMQETVNIAQAQGIAIDQKDIDKHIEITLAMGPVKTSMWQDIEAGRHTEVDAINGYVVRKAAEFQLDAPVNQMLTSLIHSIERGL